MWWGPASKGSPCPQPGCHILASAPRTPNGLPCLTSQSPRRCWGGTSEPTAPAGRSQRLLPSGDVLLHGVGSDDKYDVNAKRPGTFARGQSSTRRSPSVLAEPSTSTARFHFSTCFSGTAFSGPLCSLRPDPFPGYRMTSTLFS